MRNPAMIEKAKYLAQTFTPKRGTQATIKQNRNSSRKETNTDLGEHQDWSRLLQSTPNHSTPNKKLRQSITTNEQKPPRPVKRGTASIKPKTVEQEPIRALRQNKPKKTHAETTSQSVITKQTPTQKNIHIHSTNSNMTFTAKESKTHPKSPKHILKERMRYNAK
ncbi:hypothetical protein L1887_35860 [Cichorium endivia]|nr:hypothetical protein L1887_35860 [Cichorium endivia]